MQINKEGKEMVLNRSVIRSKVKREEFLNGFLWLAKQKGLLRASDAWAINEQSLKLEESSFRIAIGRWSLSVNDGNVELLLD